MHKPGDQFPITFPVKLLYPLRSQPKEAQGRVWMAKLGDDPEEAITMRLDIAGDVAHASFTWDKRGVKIQGEIDDDK